MPLVSDPPFPKTQGDNIRSKDWNDAINEIVRLDNAKVNRNGAETISGPLTVGANVRSGNVTIGPWPANPSYQMIGLSTLDQTNGANYALLMGTSGGLDTNATMLNSPKRISLRIANAEKASVEGDGSFRVAGPLVVGSNVQSGGLSIGPWPANNSYGFVGVSTLNQAAPGNYALLQGTAGGDAGVTFVNSPQSLRFRINNTDRAVLENDGKFTFNASTNGLRITDNWSGFPDTATNRAEISNDVGSYKTLMIIGNKSNGGGRRVSVWDRLEVNGDLFVTGRIGSYGKPTTPLTSGWGGGLRTWDIEAEGTIWSRNNVQTGARDLAETYFSDVALEPGDVVSLDPDSERIVRADGPDDSAVIGIVSSEPGLLLNSQLNVEPRADALAAFPIALAGCVPCKVTDANGPIRRGDLLTAATGKPGFAMRARTVEVDGKPIYPGGSLIGKALAAHAEGEGAIEVFVMLR